PRAMLTRRPGQRAADQRNPAGRKAERQLEPVDAAAHGVAEEAVGGSRERLACEQDPGDERRAHAPRASPPGAERPGQRAGEHTAFEVEAVRGELPCEPD